MSTYSSLWTINPNSQFHFRHWNDGVVLYLEGEGSIYLLNHFAASLLEWLIKSTLSTNQIATRLLEQYPDDTFDNIAQMVEATLSELRARSLVMNTKSNKVPA